jgi:hypothetical protein
LGNREKFISRWGKIRQKGKAKFILNRGILFAALYWALSILQVLIEKRDLSQITKYFSHFIMLFIVYIIALPIGWNRHERKYNELLGNK